MLELSFMLDELIKSYPEFKLLTHSSGIILVEKDSNIEITSIFSKKLPNKMTKAIRQKIYDKVKLSLETHYNTYKEILNVIKQLNKLDETKVEFKIGDKNYYYEPRVYKRRYKFIFQVKNEHNELVVEATYDLIGKTIKFKEIIIYNPEELKVTVYELQKILIKEIKKMLQIHEEYNKLSEKSRYLFTKVSLID